VSDHHDGTVTIRAGMDTTRVPTHVPAAEAERRRQRDAAALAYLDRSGNSDVAEILGLVVVPVQRRTRQLSAAMAKAGERQCAVCGATYAPSDYDQQTCGRSCGATLANTKRHAKNKEQP